MRRGGRSKVGSSSSRCTGSPARLLPRLFVTRAAAPSVASPTFAPRPSPRPPRFQVQQSLRAAEERLKEKGEASEGSTKKLSEVKAKLDASLKRESKTMAVRDWEGRDSRGGRRSLPRRLSPPSADPGVCDRASVTGRL